MMNWRGKPLVSLETIINLIARRIPAEPRDWGRMQVPRDRSYFAARADRAGCKG